jgi:ABC-type sugar transport system ATPase subunit
MSESPARSEPPVIHPLFSASGICKNFGATAALIDVDFALASGEVHALVGANGAGKSTLSRIISGHLPPDRGEMALEGRKLRHTGTRDAIRSGIAMVTQETSLAPDLSVLENVMLPRLAMAGRVRWSALRRQAQALIDELGQESGLSLDALVGELSIGQRQMVEILKALALNSRIIIFDEPTASLSPLESEVLFTIMRALAARGHGLIFVSHRLEEIFTVTDRITVLREGRVVAQSAPTAGMAQGELVRLMVGRELSDVYSRTAVDANAARKLGKVMLRVAHLVYPPRVRDVSFEVRAGEILGLAGLVGAGRSETLETIFGLHRPTGGTIEFDGRPFRPRSPHEAIRSGLGFIPEDRRRQGIVPDFSVRENLLLAHLGDHVGLGLAYDHRTRKVRELLELLGLPEQRLLDANMLNFSGGMQQKVILARWLVLAPKVLLLDEPTRGVDIGTRSSIYALLRRIAAEGVALVVVSSDFEEVIGLADRIVVFSDGVTVTDIPGSLVDIENLAMFAAPRSSAERTRTVLIALTKAHGGVAYWVGIDGERLFCFDRVGEDPGADPGFAGGSSALIRATAIPAALTARSDGFVTESDGTRRTLLVPLTGRRGHELGMIGLTLAAAAGQPDAAAVRRRILEMTAVRVASVQLEPAA